MHSPTDSDPALAQELLVPGHPFTVPELQAMALSGLVRPVVAGLHVSAAVPSTVELRSAAVLQIAAPVLAGQWCVVGRTAAWVHIGGSVPVRLEAAVSHFHRRPALSVALPLALSELDVAAPAGGVAAAQADVVELGGLRCTTVERTVEDLLRDEEFVPWDLALQHTVQRLVARCDPDQLRDRFERRRRLPRMLQAREWLESVLERTVVSA